MRKKYFPAVKYTVPVVSERKSTIHLWQNKVLLKFYDCSKKTYRVAHNFSKLPVCRTRVRSNCYPRSEGPSFREFFVLVSFVWPGVTAPHICFDNLICQSCTGLDPVFIHFITFLLLRRTGVSTSNFSSFSQFELQCGNLNEDRSKNKRKIVLVIVFCHIYSITRFHKRPAGAAAAPVLIISIFRPAKKKESRMNAFPPLYNGR